MRRNIALFFVASVALALVGGCAKKPVIHEAETTSAWGRKSGVRVSEDLRKLCKIQVDNIERAPKFDYDDADLQPEDRDVLEQIARCVTTGPLKGRHLSLVGRCDPRGEVEYNMILGEYRAETVHDYLAKLGVDPATMAKTSRGELDAEGKDEDGWRRDRRVDIALKGQKAKSTKE